MTRPATRAASGGERSEYGCSRRPSHRMPEPTRAAASPMTRAQPNSPAVGEPKCGRPGMAREKVPRPVQAFSPMKMSEPMPAASRPGTSTSPSIGPPSPDASISRNAPMMGEPSSVLMAAKLPAEARTAAAWSGTSRRAARRASTTSPPPMAMRGASGPSTAPKIKVARAARMTPGSWAGRRGPVGLESFRRGRAAGAGQVPDGQPGQDAAHRQHGQRPPQRLGPEAQAVRKMGEDLRLEVVDQREEAVGGGGDRYPESRRDDQQPEVTPAAQQGARIRRRGHRSIVSRTGPSRLTC